MTPNASLGFGTIDLAESVRPTIAIRCPNHPDLHSDRECRAFCGGPAKETIEAFGFITPFRLLMQCGNCRAFFEVTLNHRNDIPHLRVIPKGEHIETLESSVFFGLESVEGQRAQ